MAPKVRPRRRGREWDFEYSPVGRAVWPGEGAVWVEAWWCSPPKGGQSGSLPPAPRPKGPVRDFTFFKWPSPTGNENVTQLLAKWATLYGWWAWAKGGHLPGCSRTGALNGGLFWTEPRRWESPGKRPRRWGGRVMGLWGLASSLGSLAEGAREGNSPGALAPGL